MLTIPLKSKISIRLLSMSVFLLGMLGAGTAAAQVSSYSGRAFGQQTTILGATSTWADTGQLPATGGTLSASTISATGTGLLNFTSNTLSATVTGAGTQTQAQASVNGTNGTASGTAFSADHISSTATAQCTGDVPSVSGSSTVQNLVIGGVSTSVTGAPNQVINLPLGIGRIIINEQTSSISGHVGNITVNAIHMTIFGVSENIIASSQAGIDCTPTCTMCGDSCCLP